MYSILGVIKPRKIYQRRFGIVCFLRHQSRLSEGLGKKSQGKEISHQRITFPLANCTHNSWRPCSALRQCYFCAYRLKRLKFRWEDWQNWSSSQMVSWWEAEAKFLSCLDQVPLPGQILFSEDGRVPGWYVLDVAGYILHFFFVIFVFIGCFRPH